MEYVRHHISTQYHLIGTATMGEVVDDRLKVKGVNRLRVIDASVSNQPHQRWHLRHFQPATLIPSYSSEHESIALLPWLTEMK
jgi:hypothetical protein